MYTSYLLTVKVPRDSMDIGRKWSNILRGHAAMPYMIMYWYKNDPTIAPLVSLHSWALVYFRTHRILLCLSLSLSYQGRLDREMRNPVHDQIQAEEWQVPWRAIKMQSAHSYFISPFLESWLYTNIMAHTFTHMFSITYYHLVCYFFAYHTRISTVRCAHHRKSPY
jgi:hypothetical protein